MNPISLQLSTIGARPRSGQRGAPEALDNRVAEYPVAAEIREDYEQELRTWMSNGWLVPYKEEELGPPPPKGLIPLIAVLQQHKSKVRTVMDFRQLNCYVDVFTAYADVCAAKLCEWREKGPNVSLLDLKRAYLQVRVQMTLWPFQTVKIGRQRYCLTRLWFGLNVAPLIMKVLVSAVLSWVEAVGHTASAYIDDIYVNEDVMPVTCVREHLARFGHECKDLEQLEDGARVLGLAFAMEHGKLQGSRHSRYCHMMGSVLFMREACRALSSVWLAPCGLWITQVEGKLGHKELGWWDEGQLAVVYDIWDCGLCVARQSSPWRLVCRWTGIEHVGRCQLLSDRSSIGETRNIAWGCLLMTPNILTLPNWTPC